MSDSNRQERVRILVDAIRLTVAALRTREWEVAHSRAPLGEMRPDAAAWWPMPEPRGWPTTQLGTERRVMISYFVPQMIPIGYGSPMIGGIGSPVIGGIGGPGLIHSGIGVQPIYRSHGMIPYGHGYGLLHSGQEIPASVGYGGIGYGSIGPMGSLPMGQLPVGYVPVGPQGSIPVGSPVGNPMGPALQPAWSGVIGSGI